MRAMTSSTRDAILLLKENYPNLGNSGVLFEGLYVRPRVDKYGMNTHAPYAFVGPVIAIY